MNAEKPSILVPAEFGAPFEGGFYAGQIRSHDGTKTFAIAAAPKSAEFKGKWLGTYKGVPDARSCFHSMDNTRAMAEAGSKAAQKVLELTTNGHSDWCIPARDVNELLYRNLKPGTTKNWAGFRDGDNPSSLPPGYPYTEDAPEQTLSDAFRTGGAEAFDEAWYWSSTQYSSGSAWIQTFSHGSQDTGGKESELLFRPVRLIQLNP